MIGYSMYTLFAPRIRNRESRRGEAGARFDSRTKTSRERTRGTRRSRSRSRRRWRRRRGTEENERVTVFARWRVRCCILCAFRDTSIATRRTFSPPSLAGFTPLPGCRDPTGEIAGQRVRNKGFEPYVYASLTDRTDVDRGKERRVAEWSTGKRALSALACVRAKRVRTSGRYRPALSWRARKTRSFVSPKGDKSNELREQGPPRH